MNNKTSANGFTLIEVLVSMVILVTTLTVIFRISEGGLQKISVAGDYTRATMVAESILAATGRTELLKPGETSGQLLDKYNWSRSIRPYQLTGLTGQKRSPLIAYQVDVNIYWPGTVNRRSIELTTLRLINLSSKGVQ